MSRFFRRELAAFTQDRRGVFAVITSLMLFVLVTVGGMAVDFSRAQMAKERLQFAVDSAALAVGKVTESYEDPEDAILDYVVANIDGSVIKDGSLQLATNISETPASRQVAIEASAKVDGIFTAFFGVDEIQVNARSETYEAYQNLEIAIALDVSNSMKNARIAELRKAAKEFVGKLLKSEKDRELRHISLIPYGAAVALPTGLNRFLRGQFEDAYWNGCFNYGDDIFRNDNLFRNGSLDPYPHFHFWGNHLLCSQDREAIFLENNVDVLEKAIDNMTATGGSTRTDVATAWALRAVSPKWRGIYPGAPAHLPADYGDAIKVLVIMTDGAVTGELGLYGYDPRTHFTPGPAANRAPLAPSVFPEDFYLTTFDDGLRNFLKACDTAKNKNGVVVYTVCFLIEKDKPRQGLKDCATTEDHYSFAESGELSAAFDRIALGIDSLKLRK
ncbi:MAG: TadE/TadG family type IV pilus assembly protein [Pseudomonadota bacterium]